MYLGAEDGIRSWSGSATLFLNVFWSSSIASWSGSLGWNGWEEMVESPRCAQWIDWLVDGLDSIRSSLTAVIDSMLWISDGIRLE